MPASTLRRSPRPFWRWLRLAAARNLWLAGLLWASPSAAPQSISLQWADEPAQQIVERARESLGVQIDIEPPAMRELRLTGEVRAADVPKLLQEMFRGHDFIAEQVTHMGWNVLVLGAVGAQTDAVPSTSAHDRDKKASRDTDAEFDIQAAEALLGPDLLPADNVIDTREWASTGAILDGVIEVVPRGATRDSAKR